MREVGVIKELILHTNRLRMKQMTNFQSGSACIRLGFSASATCAEAGAPTVGPCRQVRFMPATDKYQP